ncbi:DciA family protein [Candidatus Spongiihabitans sp.]|uniref:DciA family protein n=1 Tax=Candidatus Spongiihabitans sp. TaxID=3101308 RepID=UPI003C6FB8B6
MKEFKSIAGMIKNSLPISKDPPVVEHLQQSLIDYWREQVGIAAPHTRPLLFQSGRLVVFCDSAAWATQIRHQKPSLSRQLNDNNFKISDINIKIRPASSFRPLANHSRKKINPISKDNANAICDLATKIGHSELRKSLLQLSKRCRTKTNGRPS